MESVLESIPHPVRERAQRALRSRERERARQLSQDEHLIRRDSGNTADRTARELASRHLRHHEANFQDKLKTWTPLVQKYAPESVGHLRAELLNEVPLDATVPPAQMQRFLKHRLQTFSRYLTDDSAPKARGVRATRRRRRAQSGKKTRRSEPESKE